jgi:Ras-related protein Rab-18
MLFLEASAKTKLGIRQVFMEVVQKILDNPDALADAVPGKPKMQIKRPSALDEDDDGGCC